MKDFNVRLFAVLLLIVCKISVFSQISSVSTNSVLAAGQNAVQDENIRLKRLSDLAKVWGTVKFFHPYLAYRKINWDEALIKTIPLVNSAKTPQDYQSAINQMFSFLNDKATRAEIDGKAATTVKETQSRTEETSRLDKDVLIIRPFQLAALRVKSGERYRQELQKIFQAAALVKNIVIDVRSRNITSVPGFYIHDFFHNELAKILDFNLTLSSWRYRVHNGYASQLNVGSGGYYSGLFTDTPQIIFGTSKTKTPKLAFIIDTKTPSTDVLGALQATRHALIIQEGEPIEQSVNTFTMSLTDNVSVKIRKAEMVNSDGTIGFNPNLLLPQDENPDAAIEKTIKALQKSNLQNSFIGEAVKISPPLSEKDEPYAAMEFPDKEYRLLALFRFWNIINFFYPYKHLFDKSWDDVLPRYISEFEADTNALEYQTTVREMIAEVPDSHVTVYGAKIFDNQLGGYFAPVQIAPIEGKSVVVKFLDEETKTNSGLQIGDEITAINGVSVSEIFKQRAKYWAASNSRTLLRNLHNSLLRGKQNDSFKLSVKGATGNTRNVELKATLTGAEYLDKREKIGKNLPVFGVLHEGFGYVDLGRLKLEEVDKMFEAIKATPATIFDMRGYPDQTAGEIASRLTNKTNITGALLSRPILMAINLGSTNFGESKFAFEQKLPERKGDVYQGKVVMLINEVTQSQAEHLCLFFEAATNVTFIGTPTAGTNGDVTDLVLPGKLTVIFSGHDVRHSDGRQLQRLGIQPTIKAAPTIEGIRKGKDEILDAAISYLGKLGKQQ